MDSAANILILLTFLAEVVLLTTLDKRLWGTLFTPLNMLSIPYTVVLLLMLLVQERLDFVAFYYPSLLIWMGGLLLTAIPSWIIGYNYRKRGGTTLFNDDRPDKERTLMIFCAVLIIPFLFRLKGMMSSVILSFGSDEFGENFATYGIYGHLLHLLIASSIVLFSCVRKGNRVFPITIIVAVAFLAFVNQVKSWVIIPIIAGLLLCLLTNRIHLSAKMLMGIGIGGFAIFVSSYLVMFTYGNDLEYNDNIGLIIVEHEYHYVGSGVLGLSEDARLGFLETPDTDVLFAPFVNIIRAITGETYVSPINPVYLEISSASALGSNVRTFFGTIYVNSQYGSFIPLVLFFSSLFYMLRVAALRCQSVFVTAIDAWVCALLAMGWFEFYFFHLSTFEIPVFLWVLNVLDRIRIKRKEAA